MDPRTVAGAATPLASTVVVGDGVGVEDAGPVAVALRLGAGSATAGPGSSRDLLRSRKAWADRFGA